MSRNGYCKHRYYKREWPRSIPVGRHFSVVATFFVCHYRCEGKASTLDLLHDHLYHLFVTQESEQLAGKATVPVSVISRCQINITNTAPAFIFAFKEFAIL